MSKKNKAENKGLCNVRKTSIGGQALIEGIMMRGPKRSAMAVRDPKGNMVLEEWENKVPKRPKICKWPIVRGVFGFIDSMSAGYKCLMRSAEIAIDEEAEELARAEKKKAKKATKETAEAAEVTEAADVPAESTEAEATEEPANEATKNEAKETQETKENEEKADEKEKQKSESSALMNVLMIISSVLGVVLAVVLFIALPSFIYSWIEKLVPGLPLGNAALNSLVKSVVEGLMRIAVLIAYMSLVSLMKDIRRTFQYHGAEHKTIFCYEHGLELTVENVRREGRFHPRCGTSFLILMLLVSMFISFFIDPIFILTIGYVPHVAIRSAVKLLLLPINMGIGYELIKIAGKYNNLFTRVISAPGVWLQHITVLEPDDSMIECAIAAFVKVIPEEDK